MSIIQSDWGAGRKMAPVSREAGTVKCERYTYTIPAGLAVADGDIIELGILPAYHTVVDAILVLDEAGTATYDVGIMSGKVGDPSASRTSGNELFAAAADASTTRMTKSAGFRIAPVEADRSIGVKAVGAGITGAGQVVDLVLFFKQ
jgi:hypothetical protein